MKKIITTAIYLLYEIIFGGWMRARAVYRGAFLTKTAKNLWNWRMCAGVIPTRVLLPINKVIFLFSK